MYRDYNKVLCLKITVFVEIQNTQEMGKRFRDNDDSLPSKRMKMGHPSILHIESSKYAKTIMQLARPESLFNLSSFYSDRDFLEGLDSGFASRICSLKTIDSSIDYRSFTLLEDLDFMYRGGELNLPASIKNLVIRGCSVEEIPIEEATELPSVIFDLPVLRTLWIDSFSLLTSLPVDLWNIPQMRELVVSDCLALNKIPDPVEGLKLEKLSFVRCDSIETLPDPLVVIFGLKLGVSKCSHGNGVGHPKKSLSVRLNLLKEKKTPFVNYEPHHEKDR